MRGARGAQLQVVCTCEMSRRSLSTRYFLTSKLILIACNGSVSQTQVTHGPACERLYARATPSPCSLAPWLRSACG